MQNEYNLANRSGDDLVDFCEQNQIGFIPFFPLAAGALAKPGSPLMQVAERHDAVPGQISLAWLLHRSPVIIPIPGTGSIAHLEENVAADAINLTDDEQLAVGRAADAS